ncbi:MAG: dihydrolipoyl dehydrogenase, partial [Dehalococcoidia bacterium]|nr:dihydrolipoyl dehydrogenase [Dehalococcoidia bacterium]
MRILVIGGGPAGYTAAICAAQLGGQVTLVEKGALGGTCLNRGCIPTKALLHSAHLLHSIRRAGEVGIRVTDASVGLPSLMDYKKGVVARLRQGLQGLMGQNRIRVVSGGAALVSAGKAIVEDSGEEIEADAIIVAPGSRPRGLTAAQGVPVWGSDEALSPSRLPSSLVVIGGGVVGLEFAQLYHRLGTTVTVVEALPRILPGEDPEITDILSGLLKQEGIDIITGVGVEGLRQDGEEVVVGLTGSEPRAVAVLIATGRQAVTDGLGLEGVGVIVEKGCIVVDEAMRTTASGILAAGDATGDPMLAHAAMAEGEVAAHSATGHEAAMDYSAVPRCLYTSPELASVGLSEEEARQQHGRVKVSRFPLAASGRAQVLGEGLGMVKVVAGADHGEILGV